MPTRCIAILSWIVFPVLAGEFVLVDPSDYKTALATGWDASASPRKDGETALLRIDIGQREDWPGITFKAPGGTWNLAAFDWVETDVRNSGTTAVDMGLRVDNEGADGVLNCNTIVGVLKPGERRTLRAAIVRKGSHAHEKVFGMRGVPPPVRNEPGTIDPSRVTQVIVFVAQPEKGRVPHTLDIGPIRAGGNAPTILKNISFFPFIDAFGQYIHAEWPGKILKPEDLSTRRDAETQELAAQPGPADRNAWGGWSSGPQLDASGFFRTAKHEGKWWFVDPDGRLFWSHGIDVVNSDGGTPIDERKHWFRDFPGEQPAFREFLFKAHEVLHEHYKGRHPDCFDFLRANLKRKYGTEWPGAVRERTHARLRSWGINTIGNWSDPALYLMRKTPYTVNVYYWSPRIAGSEGYWGQFPDPFDPAFKANLAQGVAKQAATFNDPWCIGYFIDNELAWGDSVSLAVAALRSPPEQAAKAAFLKLLTEKYGTIEKLNTAWGTQHASWEAFKAFTKEPPVARAKMDLEAFYSVLAESYFSQCRDVLRASAPRQLYLGCRFAWNNPLAVKAAGKFCDVVSFNLYVKDIATFESPADVPLLVGEFHFGALDRGMFHPGLVPVKDQQERARAYASYVTGALKHPQFVGTHWFQYVDESPIGRPLDGENYQVGFIDICDTPYAELVESARKVSAELYRLRSGQK